MKKFLINLERSQERLSEFYRLNPKLSQLERFNAIDGSTLSRDELVQSGVITNDLPYTMTAIGSAISHMTLWRRAIELDEPITIFEDDAILCDDFENQCQKMLLELGEDWDFILWGWCFDAYLTVDFIPGVSPARIAFFQDQMRMHTDIFRTAEYRRRLVRLLHGMGLPCYSVSPRGANLLIDFCTPLPAAIVDFEGFGVRLNNTTLDRFTNAKYRKMESYVVIPPLVIVENYKSKSTIENS